MERLYFTAVDGVTAYGVDYLSNPARSVDELRQHLIELLPEQEELVAEQCEGELPEGGLTLTFDVLRDDDGVVVAHDFTGRVQYRYRTSGGDVVFGFGGVEVVVDYSFDPDDVVERVRNITGV